MQSGASWIFADEVGASSTWSIGRGTFRRSGLDNSLLRGFYSAHPDKPERAPVEGGVMLGSGRLVTFFFMQGAWWSFSPAAGGDAGRCTCGLLVIKSAIYSCLPVLECFVLYATP